MAETKDSEDIETPFKGLIAFGIVAVVAIILCAGCGMISILGVWIAYDVHIIDNFGSMITKDCGHDYSFIGHEINRHNGTKNIIITFDVYGVTAHDDTYQIAMEFKPNKVPEMDGGLLHLYQKCRAWGWTKDKQFYLERQTYTDKLMIFGMLCLNICFAVMFCLPIIIICILLCVAGGS